jgi:hypothetical protein
MGTQEEGRATLPLDIGIHSIYDVREQVRMVLEASRQGAVKWVILDDPVWLGGRDLKTWDDVARAVDAVWPEGIQVVEQMLAKLDKAKLPKPKSLRPRRAWSEDDGSDFDLDRLRYGQPFWRTVERQRVCGPRVITLAVQIGGNSNRDAWSLLWRGAVCLTLCKRLEDAGYRTEVVAYDYGVGTMETYDACAQATWVKRSSERLHIPALINCVSGWYFRTVNFGSLSIVPGQTPNCTLGSERTIPPELLAYLSRGKVVPWVVQNIWDEQTALQEAQRFLVQLTAEDNDRIVLPR